MVEKEFIYRGLICIVKFNEVTGCRCGYVEIPENNKLYMKDGLCERELHCHCGITSIQIENYIQYFVGFDCAHFPMDIPDIDFMYHNNMIVNNSLFEIVQTAKNSKYIGKVWKLEDVEEEIKQLADQIVKYNIDGGDNI